MTTAPRATLTMADLQNLQVGYITPAAVQAAGIYAVDAREGTWLIASLMKGGVR